MDTSESQIPVLISGGGPVGLSLGLLLARFGVRSIVIEKKAELDPHSRALGILPRTLEILRDLKLLDSFMEQGVFVQRPQIWMPGRAAPAVSIDLSPLEKLTAMPGLLILPQDGTERLLLKAVEECELCDVRFSHQLLSFTQDKTGVQAQVRGGGRDYEIRAEYLAGCDGAHSNVREQLGWQLSGKTYPSRIMLADIELKDSRDDLPWPRTVTLPNAILVALRYAEGRWRIIHTLTPEQSEEAALSPDYVSSLVQQLHGPGEFGTLWKSVFHIHCRRSARWVDKRVVLCGDAAHLDGPAGGQGMNSGIQDAHNLAWKLAAALNGGDERTLLSTYEKERSSAIQNGVERFTDLLTRTVLLSSPRQRTAFFLAAAVAFRFRPLRELAMKRATMLDGHYPHNAILKGPHPLLGSRAPDGEISKDETKKRLLDTVFPHPALLLFDDGRLPRWNENEIRDAIENATPLKIEVVRLLSRDAAPEENAWRDATGEIWKTWRLTEPTAALLQQDGHIGWIEKRPSPEALRAGVKTALGG